MVLVWSGSFSWFGRLQGAFRFELRRDDGTDEATIHQNSGRGHGRLCILLARPLISTAAVHQVGGAAVRRRGYCRGPAPRPPLELLRRRACRVVVGDVRVVVVREPGLSAAMVHPGPMWPALHVSQRTLVLIFVLVAVPSSQSQWRRRLLRERAYEVLVVDDVHEVEDFERRREVFVVVVVLVRRPWRHALTQRCSHGAAGSSWARSALSWSDGSAQRARGPRWRLLRRSILAKVGTSANVHQTRGGTPTPPSRASGSRDSAVGSRRP